MFQPFSTYFIEDDSNSSSEIFSLAHQEKDNLSFDSDFTMTQSYLKLFNNSESRKNLRDVSITLSVGFEFFPLKALLLQAFPLPFKLFLESMGTCNILRFAQFVSRA